MDKKAKSVITAISLTILFIIFYYFLFVFKEKYLYEICKSYYCIDFLPFGDFLTIIISIISLYFVIVSLNSWKAQFSHQTAQRLYFDFMKLSYDLIKLQSEFYKLKEDGNPQKQYTDYLQYIQENNFKNRFEELDLQMLSLQTKYSKEIRDLYFSAAETFDQIHLKFLFLLWNNPDTIIDRNEIIKLSKAANKSFINLSANLTRLKNKLNIESH